MKNHRRRSIATTTTVSSILPDDLIVEILLRLSVRSLVRLKSVCKSWLSLISDPQFGESHFDLASSPTHRCLTKVNRSEIESIDVDASLHNEDSLTNLKYPLPPNRNQNFERFGRYPPKSLCSFSGFILVASACGEVFVWNPSTGFKKKIAKLNNLYYNLHGFEYDASKDDYLVFQFNLINYQGFILSDYPSSISIFSLKNNSQSYPEVASDDLQCVELDCRESQAGFLLNGTLHWLVGSYRAKRHVVIAFDLVERSLSEIPLAQVLAGKLENYGYCLWVMGECLCLCNPGSMTSMAEIWIMKTYKVESSWTKIFAFSTCNVPGNVFYPIRFTKHGRIFGSNFYERLMILNDNGSLHDLRTAYPKSVEKDCDIYKEDSLNRGMYRESLLSLPYDFEEESDDSEETSEDDQLTSSLEESSEDDQ